MNIRTSANDPIADVQKLYIVGGMKCGVTIMNVALPLCLVALSGCSTISNDSYQSDFHQYEVLRSFKAPPIEQVEGQSIRLTWHAWHKTPGLILANCSDGQCRLELRFTDGYGTYRQGNLKGIRKADISRKEFEEVALALKTGGFYGLEPQLREHNGLAPLPSAPMTMCFHAPSYYLEASDDNHRHLIYRYCQKNYQDGLLLAMPFIELAERHFPDEMANIVAAWIEEERDAKLLNH